MSLIVTTFVPDGIVLSSDSRVLMNINIKNDDVVERSTLVLSDTSSKIFLINNKIGIAAYGQLTYKNLPISEYISRFQASCIKPEAQIDQIPQILLDYFLNNVGDSNNVFNIAGYRIEDNYPVPYVYMVDVAQKFIRRLNQTESGYLYSSVWGGETDIISRLMNVIKIQNRDEWVIKERNTVHYEFMSLEDAISFSRFLLHTSVEFSNYILKHQRVGGNIVSLVLPKLEEPYWI